MKTRLDQYLVTHLGVESRERAKAYIMAGQVYINNQKALKAGDTVKPEDKVEFRGNKIPFVSRGGLKLSKAIKEFQIDLEKLICMDIGASTGGFTDCMLQQKAKKVYAVDVGYGQLAYQLRVDERVVNMERTNIRYVTQEEIGEEIDFASIDVSFISLKLVLPVLFALLKEEGEAVCLIKPQFEAGKDKIGKKGVVREKTTHIEVIERVLHFTVEIGFLVKNISFSPVKGPEGNIEYLMYIKKASEGASPFTKEQITDIVELSHSQLD